MAVSITRRMTVLAGIMATAIALVLPASPASAQAGGPGAQATPLVGVSGTANCPTAVPAAQVAGTWSAGGFTVGGPAGGSCTSFSANTQGSYTLAGAVASALPFSSSCQTGGLESGGGVDVPAGTTVNPGTPGQFVTTAVTTITTPNTTVIYPGGTTAVLNQVITTGTTVTRNAIVANGQIVGQVVCGAAAAYPLAVDVASASPAPPLLPATSSGGGGMTTTTVIGLAALALAVVGAQLLVGRSMWRRKGDATG